MYNYLKIELKNPNDIASSSTSPYIQMTEGASESEDTINLYLEPVVATYGLQ